jgi:protein TonB
MRYPILSASLSSIIWILIIILASFFLNAKPQFLPPSIDIEVNLITKENSNLSKPNPVTDKLESKKKILTPEKNPKISNQQTTENNDQKPVITYRPLPQIPDDLRQEAFKSYAIARFNINLDGLATVELIQPCSNPKLNYLLLKSLRKWKFTNINRATIQDIRVEFKVE